MHTCWGGGGGGGGGQGRGRGGGSCKIIFGVEKVTGAYLYIEIEKMTRAVAPVNNNNYQRRCLK